MNPQTSSYGMSIPPLEQITVSVRLPDLRFFDLIGKEVDGLISREELRELDELFRQKELGDAPATLPPLCGPDGPDPLDLVERIDRSFGLAKTGGAS